MHIITLLRRFNGENQKELAEALQISQSTLSKWERGEHEPGIDGLIALSEHFKCSVDYLLRHNPKPEKEQIYILGEYIQKRYDFIAEGTILEDIDFILADVIRLLKQSKEV